MLPARIPRGQRKATMAILINIKNPSISFKRVENTATSTIFTSVMISMDFVPFATVRIAMWGTQLIIDPTGCDRVIPDHGFLNIFHLKRKLVSSRK